MINFNNTEIAFKYKTNSDLKRAKMLFKVIGSPSMVTLGKRVTYLALGLRIPVAWAIKPTLYHHFVGGESIEECKPTVKLMEEYHVKSILDYSVEGGADVKTMDHTLQETLRTIENAASNHSVHYAVFKPTAFATVDLLTKVTEKAKLTPEEQDAYNRFNNYVETLCKRAFELNIPVMIDAEDSWYQSLVDETCTKMMERYNKEKAIVFNTLQMYRTDRIDFLKKSLEEAKKGGYILGLKFVRGAYMEKERERAAKNGYPSPIQPDKESTDKAYNEALSIAVDNISQVEIFCGTHNEVSNQHLAKLMEQHGLAKNDPRIWFSQLYGMSDNISFNLAHEGFNVTKYMPYGPVRNILPYLIRRAEENTSIAGQTPRESLLVRQEIKRRKSFN